jgi:hypothetical protein
MALSEDLLAEIARLKASEDHWIAVANERLETVALHLREIERLKALVSALCDYRDGKPVEPPAMIMPDASAYKLAAGAVVPLTEGLLTTDQIGNLISAVSALLPATPGASALERDVEANT